MCGAEARLGCAFCSLGFCFNCACMHKLQYLGIYAHAAVHAEAKLGLDVKSATSTSASSACHPPRRLDAAGAISGTHWSRLTEAAHGCMSATMGRTVRVVLVFEQRQIILVLTFVTWIPCLSRLWSPGCAYHCARLHCLPALTRQIGPILPPNRESAAILC